MPLELNKIYCGDCLELMKAIPDQSVNLILADLPYGITANKKDVPLQLPALWDEYNRIITPAGNIVLFASGLFYIDLVNSNRDGFRYDLVWNKYLTSGHLNVNKMPLRQHEHIAVFGNPSSIYNPQKTVGQPLHSRGKTYTTEITNNYNQFGNKRNTAAGETSKYPTSILNFQKDHPSKKLHRTSKPVSLLEYLIKTYSNLGDLVLDNTAGFGSTGKACINTQRKFILIDIDPAACDGAKKNYAIEIVNR